MGVQDFNSRRDIIFTDPVVSDFNQELKADYDGQTISAAMEVSRPTPLSNNVFVRPSIGYSYQNIKLDEIRESAAIDQARSLAQRISSSSFNIQQARIGADINWVNPNNTVTVGARAFLVANLGDTQPEGTARFISASGSSLPFKVRGAELDDTMANLGLGLKFTPAGAEGLVISLDYDAMLGSNSQAHSLGLMLRYEF
jgi:outer membrane autotransporter protein